MIVEKENIDKSFGSCNFCNKGELTRNGDGLTYPYNVIYTFTKGNGLKAAICDECFDELSLKINTLKKNNP